MKMPVKYGGLCVSLPTDVALPVYLASTAASKNIVEFLLSANSSLHGDA